MSQVPAKIRLNVLCSLRSSSGKHAPGGTKYALRRPLTTAVPARMVTAQVEERLFVLSNRMILNIWSGPNGVIILIRTPDHTIPEHQKNLAYTVAWGELPNKVPICSSTPLDTIATRDEI